MRDLIKFKDIKTGQTWVVSRTLAEDFQENYENPNNLIVVSYEKNFENGY